MNAPTKAAFRASFSDWKLIRSRKVVQLVFEVPIEAADQAYAILGGMPNPAAEVWCAIARLMPQAEAVADKPIAPRKPVAAGKRLVAQAGRVCSEASFWRFLEDQHGCEPISNEDKAAAFVRRFCGVDSRSQIVLGTAAAAVWDRLYGAYVAWERV